MSASSLAESGVPGTGSRLPRHGRRFDLAQGSLSGLRRATKRPKNVGNGAEFGARSLHFGGSGGIRMTKPFREWTVLPHGKLTRLDDNILTVTGRIHMPLGDVERRMTCVRLR